MWRLMYIYVEGVGGGGGIVWGLFQEDTDRRLLSVYKLNCARDSGDNFFAYEKDNKEEDFELIKVNILNEQRKVLNDLAVNYGVQICDFYLF